VPDFTLAPKLCADISTFTAAVARCWLPRKIGDFHQTLSRHVAVSPFIVPSRPSEQRLQRFRSVLPEEQLDNALRARAGMFCGKNPVSGSFVNRKRWGICQFDFIDEGHWQVHFCL
jgi:hypothetical protein